MDLDKIVNTALSIEHPELRSAYLDEACSDDTKLREIVEGFLRARTQPGSKLQEASIDQHPKEPVVTVDQTTVYLPKTEGNDQPTVGANERQNRERVWLAFLTPSDNPRLLGRLHDYDILGVLGHGGFGIVLKGLDTKLNRLVAIKVMNPQLAEDSRAQQRFLREARAIATIRNQNVVQVYAVDDRPLPFLVMEFIDGSTLQQTIDESGPLDVATILQVARQIANGLAAAHGVGIVHRDIKPSNILLERDTRQTVKITDFGLARIADDASITHEGLVLGTPMFMSPEQASGKVVDHRADLFSFGSVLYLMASGQPPFQSDSALAVLRLVSEDAPRPLRAIRPEIPDWLVGIVSILHAKDPDERFQSAGEIRELLDRCQHELTTQGEVTCISSDSQSANHQLIWGRRRFIAKVSALTALGVLIALGFLLFIRIGMRIILRLLMGRISRFGS